MMISADTPAFLSKLCELFVQELAVRAWACAESHNRRIILDSDIAEAVAYTESYDFLIPVLLQHMHEVAQARRAAPATPPATARLVTRKRHRPNPQPRRTPRVLPVTPSPPAPPSRSSVRYMPFPFPCVLREGATPSVGELMLPAPPMNYTTRGRVFFRNGNGSGNTIAGEGSAAGMVRSPPLAGPAGELQPNVPPAAYYFCPYPVTDDSDEAFAVDNTDPSGNIGIPSGNADGNGDDALVISDGGQQEKQSENADGHGKRVVVQQSSDVHAVQDALAGVLGGTGNESPMYMLLEEVLMDEDLLFPDADLFPPWALHRISRISSSTNMFLTTSSPTQAAAALAAIKQKAYHSRGRTRAS
uniref:Uncharacterized protein n=1 Tax=Avena sativa TaxID=4498 RepID=A0ACD5WT18_AVESA